ncbi:killer cell lectin-like receptor 4 isoform X4 [Cavia porcellus]
MPDLEDFLSSPEKCFAALLGCILLISKASMLATMVAVILGKTCEVYLTCYGVKCYYFIIDNKTWEKCKQTCQNQGLSLLKIDDKDELVFLVSQIYPKKYWIGLFFDTREKRWKWMDAGRSSGINVTIMNKPPTDGKCAFLTSARISDMPCDNAYSCVCEKRMDATFPASMCRKEERP